MRNFEQKLESHCAVDVITAGLLERAVRERRSAGDAGGAGSESASLPVLVGPGGRAESKCEKCGGYCYGREPWCQECIQANAAEYSGVYRAWILENREQCLAGAGVPPAFLGCGLDNFETPTQEQVRALNAVKTWAADGSLGLYLFGPPGSGKTHLAVAALLDRMANRERGLYVSVHELMLEARESFRGPGNRPLSTILDECTSTDVLLLDDLGVEKSTEFAREVFLSLVDRAYARRRPQLIVTSNLDLTAVGRKLEERIADRLRELCVAVKVGGVSYRRRIAARREGRGT